MTDLTAATAALVDATGQIIGTKAELLAWAVGTVAGGPNANGDYPFTAADGTVVLVPCPAKIAAMNGDPAAAAATLNGIVAAAIEAGDRAESAADRVDLEVLDTALAAIVLNRADVDMKAGEVVLAHADVGTKAGEVADSRSVVVTKAAQVATDHADVVAKTAQALQYRNDSAGFRDQAQAFAAAVDTTQIADSKAATAVDKTAVHTDRLSADADALAAAGSKAMAKSYAEASGSLKFYDTRALADAALAALPDQQVIEVFADETRGGLRTRYRKEGGALIFKVSFCEKKVFYADSRYGDDANDGSAPQPYPAGTGPVKTLARLAQLMRGVYNDTGPPLSFTGLGPYPTAGVALARGSRWNGEGLINLPPFCRVYSYGQGHQPIIDASVPLPLNWTFKAERGLWRQVYTFATAPAGDFPGANCWKPGAYDEAPGFDIQDDGLPRILNGDAYPDAQYDTWQPQKTTIAVASQGALLDILAASPLGGFTLFKEGTTSYEPRTDFGANSFEIWLKTPDGSNPNTNGRTVYVVPPMVGCAAFSQGCDVEGITFARSGGKDAIGAYYLASVSSLLTEVGSGSTRDCNLLQMGGHCIVDGGMSHYDTRAMGAYHRDSYKSGCGGFHGFRSQPSVGRTPGRLIQGCRVERVAIGVYTHGSGDTPPEQHVRHDMADCVGRDLGCFFTPGQTQGAPKIIRCRGTDIDVVIQPDATDRKALIEDSEFVGRDGGNINLGSILPGTSVTLRRTTIKAGRGGGVGLLRPDFRGSFRELDPTTYPTMVMENSTLAGLILSVGNALFDQINVVMDARSKIGIFTGTASVLDMPIRGTIVAKSGARIECDSTSAERLREMYPGVEAGVETGVRRQVLSRPLVSSDFTFTPVIFGATGSYSGAPNDDGTATLTTDYTYSADYVGRAVVIVGGVAGGADLPVTVRQWIDGNHIKVSPAPPAAFAGKALKTGSIVPLLSGPATAWLSSDGTQVYVEDPTRFGVGLLVRVGATRAYHPSYGLRKITAINGNVLTWDKPCLWRRAYTNLQYNPVSNPFGSDYASLPDVTLSFDYPIIPPKGNGLSPLPSFNIAKVDGGTINGTPGIRDINFERGFWGSAKNLAVGDVLTRTWDIEVAEMRGISKGVSL